jgi:hypothetical protein
MSHIQVVTEYGIQLWKFIVTKRIVISQHSFLHNMLTRQIFLQVFGMAATDYAADIHTIF